MTEEAKSTIAKRGWTQERRERQAATIAQRRATKGVKKSRKKTAKKATKRKYAAKKLEKQPAAGTISFPLDAIPDREPVVRRYRPRPAPEAVLFDGKVPKGEARLLLALQLIRVVEKIVGG